MFYYFRNYASLDYIPRIWRDSRRRGQRRADAKVVLFYMRSAVPTMLIFEAIGQAFNSFATPFLVRKRCIGEFERKVL